MTGWLTQTPTHRRAHHTRAHAQAPLPPTRISGNYHTLSQCMPRRAAMMSNPPCVDEWRPGAEFITVIIVIIQRR